MDMVHSGDQGNLEVYRGTKLLDTAKILHPEIFSDSSDYFIGLRTIVPVNAKESRGFSALYARTLSAGDRVVVKRQIEKGQDQILFYNFRYHLLREYYTYSIYRECGEKIGIEYNTLIDMNNFPREIVQVLDLSVNQSIKEDSEKDILKVFRYRPVDDASWVIELDLGSEIHDKKFNKKELFLECIGGENINIDTLKKGDDVRLKCFQEKNLEMTCKVEEGLKFYSREYLEQIFPEMTKPRYILKISLYVNKDDEKLILNILKDDKWQFMRFG